MSCDLFVFNPLNSLAHYETFDYSVRMRNGCINMLQSLLSNSRYPHLSSTPLTHIRIFVLNSLTQRFFFSFRSPILGGEERKAWWGAYVDGFAHGGC